MMNMSLACFSTTTLRVLFIGRNLKLHYLISSVFPHQSYPALCNCLLQYGVVEILQRPLQDCANKIDGFVSSYPNSCAPPRPGIRAANSPCTRRSALPWTVGSTSPDSHSPGQRSTNENANGLLRQYFPKSTDLSIYPEAYLGTVAEELNDRLRKTLDYMKPHEKII